MPSGNISVKNHYIVDNNYIIGMLTQEYMSYNHIFSLNAYWYVTKL